MSINLLDLPDLGLGLGLRSKHFNHILEHAPEVDWFEVISENFMDAYGRPRYLLKQIVERYPVVMHGVSMSIGSTDPLDFDYLKSLKTLADEVKPAWVSDHLCWTGVLSINSHDLLPLPLNEESLAHVCERVRIVQDYLERPLVLENPSTYASFQHSTISEWAFLKAMAEETNCGLLLDVNNVYVSAFNNDFDPVHYIEQLPHERIVQMHLAGHQHCGNYIIDTHDREVTNNVWQLFQLAWQKTGGVSTLLEWDGNIPPFDDYYAELMKAKDFMSSSFPKPKMEEEAPGNAAEVSNPVDFLMTNLIKEVQTVEKPKLSLADFQKWMLQMLLQPGYGAAKIGEGRSVSIEEVFKPSSRLPARQHLAIYQHGYTARLRDCLAKQFTALEYALSPDLFQAFADEYLRKYPSESYSLANLGDRFMTYLEESRPDRDDPIKEDWPYFMIELARFEWLINHLFNADVEHEGPIATMTTPSTQLALVPGIRLLATKFPVRWFYQAVAKGEQPDLPEAQPSYCAILRRDYKLAFFDLHQEQYLLLQMLEAGQGVPEALRQLSEKHDYDAKGLAEIWPVWYAKWQRAGFFRVMVAQVQRTPNRVF